MENGTPVKFVTITKDAFNRLEEKDPGTVYFVVDDISKFESTEEKSEDKNN